MDQTLIGLHQQEQPGNKFPEPLYLILSMRKGNRNFLNAPNISADGLLFNGIKADFLKTKNPLQM